MSAGRAPTGGVLTGPVLHLQQVARTDALRLEGEMAGALADAGILVEGGH